MTGFGDSFAEVALAGPMVAAIPIAVLAGVVSFASPCVLPLVPGYVAYVTGVAGKPEDQPTRRAVTATALFVAGFTVVYVIMGLTLGAVGEALVQHGRLVGQICGAAVIVLGLSMMGVLPSIPAVGNLPKPPRGVVGAPLLGAVLAVTWAPCLGPVLGAVLALGVTTQSADRSVLLLVMYCLGLGLPFMMVAAGIGRSVSLVTVLRRHQRIIARVSGVAVIVLGVLMAADLWVPLIDMIRSGLPEGSVL